MPPIQLAGPTVSPAGGGGGDGGGGGEVALLLLPLLHPATIIAIIRSAYCAIRDIM